MASLTQLVFATYFYVFMEWLFHVTKPSFLSLFSIITNLELFLVSAFLLALLGLVPMGVLWLLGFPLRTLSSRCRALYPEGLVPAALMTVSVTLLVDNFSYTVFGFGIVTATHWAAKTAYLLAILPVFARFSYGFVCRHGTAAHPGPGHLRLAGASSLVLLSFALLVSALVNAKRLDTGLELVPESATSRKQLPNILLFASDGVEADHLSAYGYERKTSPTLDAFVDSALVVENALTNAKTSAPSDVSMLTGKLPTTVKALSTMHILMGRNSYEHLPGILKGFGYRTLQESIRFYSDAAEANMRHAFDEVNGRVLQEAGASILPTRVSFALTIERHFLEKLRRRVTERVLHLSGVEEATNVYQLVMAEKPANRRLIWKTTDEARVERAIDFMRRSDDPFFVHIHLNNHTHCIWINGRCEYLDPPKRFFSRNRQSPWADIYDDAIRASDTCFKELVSYLKDSGKLDNTLIVYSSDHGSHWRTDRRVPLIFIFPGGKHAGRIRITAQLIDVAPTILDYLNIPIPEWMEGGSLLAPETLDPLRPVFTALDAGEDSSEPYFALRGLALNVCNRRYEMTLNDGIVQSGEILNHTAPCTDASLPSEEEAARTIEEHLRERGFPLPGTVNR